jgi:ATP-binding cassette subfamily G (WHITE) protein 1
MSLNYSYVQSGTAKSGTVSGTIKVNNEQVTPTDIRKMSGFVFQDDIVMPSMTTIEVCLVSSPLDPSFL